MLILLPQKPLVNTFFAPVTMLVMTHKVIVGIDEVGRGCWAGPLVAGAVVLNRPIPGLRDSKKLTKMQRESLAAAVHMQALAVGIGWVWPQDIDRGGITAAVKWAMQEALFNVHTSYDQVIIDGNINYLVDVKVLPSKLDIRTVVRADDNVPAVSAASIVAKVARDAYMTEIAEKYPEYGFDMHVGYGTRQHIESLALHGVTDIHRRSYKPIKALLELN